MDATTFTIIMTAVSGCIGSLLTLLLTRWPRAYAEYRSERRKDSQVADDRMVRGFEAVIGELTSRLEKDEGKLVKLEADHINCLQVQAEQRAENAALNRDLKRLSDENSHLRQDVLRMDKEIDDLRDELRRPKS